MAIKPPPDISLPTPPGRPGGIGDQLEATLVRFFGRLLNSAKEALAGVIRFGFETFLEAIEPNLVALTAPIFDLLEEQEDMPDALRQILTKTRAAEHQVASILLGTVGNAAVGTATGNLIGVYLAEPTYKLQRRLQTARLDPGTLIAAARRDPHWNELMGSDLADQGWDAQRIEVAKLISEVRPGAAELVTLWLRGELADAEFEARLTQEGIAPEYISDIKKLAEAMPGPGDLVRFALREVWRDDLRGELLSPNAPSRYYELMAKQGYAHEFAEDYWASHWEIPGILQGFEMFYRVPEFKEADLRALLTRLDVLPAYHDELIKIAYRTLTRVDIRRMYALGILNADEVYQSYLELGNTPTNAKRLADFAIAAATETDRELTKTDILNGYRDGILTLSEASDMLVSINFSKEAATFLLARVDTKRAQKIIDAEVRVLKDLYLNGDLTLVQVQERLTALGLPARQIELYAQEWKIDREGKVKRPSRGTLERLYKSGAITQDEFVTTLDAIGYQPKYVGWYLRNISLERQAEAEKEEERARKERERVEKDRRKTTYQRDKAELDVEVAEVQSAIAAADVALVEAQNARADALRAALPLEERAQIERDYMLVSHDADAAIGQARIVVAELRADDKEQRSQLADIDQSLATGVDVEEQVKIKASINTMRTSQAKFTDAAALLKVEIAEKKVAIEKEDDDEKKAALKVELLELQVKEAEERQAITDVGIDIREAMEQLGKTMEEAKRQEFVVKQAEAKVEIANIAERIATANAEIAETATAKTTARNAMNAELTELPGAVQELEIRQKYDSLIERIKAQVKELQVRLSQLRVQKALLTFTYRGPTG